MVVGDDEGCVRFRAPYLDSGPVSAYGVTFLRRRRRWRFAAGGGKTEEGPGMMGVTCGSTPRTWIPACAGKTVWRVAVGGG